MDTFKYGFGTPVDGSFERTVNRVVEALQSEGFGVLRDIDVAATHSNSSRCGVVTFQGSNSQST